MNVGVIFPQTEYGSDPGAIREFAQVAEDLGFSHILTYEHVLGVDPNRPGWKGIYGLDDPFLEPFSLLSFWASITERISFLTGILILPQRQTVLAAKQAATLDVLSGGRLRLGVGIGWNEPEYIALGKNFHDRGRRIEEQIELMRILWTEPLVNFSGQWDRVEDSGMNPLPIQQPIPIWFGGHADPAIRRAARLGDGWLPTYLSVDDAKPHLAELQEYLDDAGRTSSEFGLEARIHYREGDIERMGGLMQDWREAGATHIGLNTMRSRLNDPSEHMNALRTFAEALLN
ncbi:MAG: LLM class F420-dependent oxidoreductase [Anaerolineales bacterium]